MSAATNYAGYVRRAADRAYCGKCGARVKIDCEADLWPSCRSCRQIVVAVPRPTIRREAMHIDWNPAWDTEPIPDPPPQKRGGPGAPMVLPRQTHDDRFTCPRCNSDTWTRAIGHNNSAWSYYHCADCDTRYAAARVNSGI